LADQSRNRPRKREMAWLCKLADAGFGHAQHGADLLEIHVLLVIHAHELLFPLGQDAHRLGQGALEVARRQDVEGRLGVVVGEAFQEIVAVHVVQILVVHQLGAAGIAEQFEIGLDVQPISSAISCSEGGRLCRCCSVDGVLDLPPGAPHVARGPVGVAQFVQHGAAHPLGGVGLEMGALLVVEALHGIQQAHQPGLDQVVHLHAGRQAGHHVISDALDHGEVGP
jgi:hypothetical protein